MRYLSSMRGWLSFVGGLATLVTVALVLLLVMGQVIGRILMEFGWSMWQQPLGVMDFVITAAQFIIVFGVSGYAGYKVQTHLDPLTEAQIRSPFKRGFCWMLGATAIISALVITLGYLLADKG